MRRLVVILGLTAFLAAGGQAFPATSVHTRAGIAFAPSADAYVSSGAPRRNFGRSKVLQIGLRRPLTRSYLKFDLAKIDAPITRATLRLFTRSSSRGFEVRAAGSNWSERSITFANAPRPGRQITGSGRYKARRWVSIDVTTLATGNGPVSLVLAGAEATFASRESGKRPQLVVQATPPTLIAAGDIADCAASWDEATAALVNNNPGTVAALGDLAYPNGTLADFNNCYQPSWGSFKARTRPAPGNHEYEAGTNGVGYFAYWGAAGGNPSQGWYSYDLGGWHVVSLNSNCTFIVGGCAAGSPQETWLRADLAAHKTRCTLAYWHHPMFSARIGTDEPMMMGPLWQALYDANADLVLAGHAHNYQRFAAQNTLGVVDPARGLREFVVGTGGRLLQPLDRPVANLEVANATTYGVLRLALRNSGYDWKFLPIAGQTFTDSGSQACH